MDALTHGLLGAVTAQLGFRQRLGGGATWAATAAALMPDVDVAIGPVMRYLGKNVDDLPAWAVHRGLTHSLLAPPVIALVVVIVWRIAARLRRPRQEATALAPAPGAPDLSAVHPEVQAQRQEADQLARRQRARGPALLLALACTVLAACTHPLLDACTSYGTMLLAPFNETRYAWDAIGIVDLIFTPLLLLTLMFSCVTREEQRRLRAAVAAVGLALAVGYLGAGRVAHGWVVDKVRQDAGDSFVRAEAYPAPGSIFLWRAVVQTRTKWQVLRVHLFSKVGKPELAAATKPVAPRGGLKFPPQETAILRHSPMIDLASALLPVKRFYDKANGVVGVTIEKDGVNQAVSFNDLRYGRRVGSIETLWSYVVVLDPKGKILSDGPVRRERGDLFDMVTNYWNEMVNP